MEFELTLDAVAQQPELAQQLSPEIIRVLRLRARIALAALDECPTQPASLSAGQLEPGDSLVGIKEAAKMLNVSESTLAHSEWPFRVRLGGTVRRLYSVKGIQRYIAQRTRG
jgi:hypothetical protein